jgi:hypothetical protein
MAVHALARRMADVRVEHPTEGWEPAQVCQCIGDRGSAAATFPSRPLEVGEASLHEAAGGRDHDGLTTLLRRTRGAS